MKRNQITVWASLGVALALTAGSGLVYAEKGGGGGKKPKANRTPVEVTFLDRFADPSLRPFNDKIRSDMFQPPPHHYVDGVDGVSATLDGHLIFRTDGGTKRKLNLIFDECALDCNQLLFSEGKMENDVYTVYMVVALVEFDESTGFYHNVEGSLAGMIPGKSGFARLLINLDRDNKDPWFSVHKGCPMEIVASGLTDECVTATGGMLTVTRGSGVLSDTWTVETTTDDVGRLWKHTPRNKGNNAKSEVVGDFHLSHKFTIKLK